MKLDDLVRQPSEWLRGGGPSCDIVVSSRIRLARNVADRAFTQMLDRTAAEELIGHIHGAIDKCNLLKKSLFFHFKDLSELDKQFLLERHLISYEHAQGKASRAVCFSDNEVISIMVLEEDHLRLQTLSSGFNLVEAWRIMDEMDNELGETLAYAFHPSLGFLTACPTNVGTGVRASCMLHLPALVMTKQVNRVLQAVAKLNMAVRGLYGEGTQALGNFFQFSNQITLGQKEEDIIENLARVLRQVVEHEKEARTALFGKKREKVDDQIWRALGILKTARVISSRESTALLSMVRLGVDMGMVPNLSTPQLNELFLLIQPAHLQKLSGRVLSQTERDVRRAVLLRERLQGLTAE